MGVSTTPAWGLLWKKCGNFWRQGATWQSCWFVSVTVSSCHIFIEDSTFVKTHHCDLISPDRRIKHTEMCHVKSQTSKIWTIQQADQRECANYVNNDRRIWRPSIFLIFWSYVQGLTFSAQLARVNRHKVSSKKNIVIKLFFPKLIEQKIKNKSSHTNLFHHWGCLCYKSLPL